MKKYISVLLCLCMLLQNAPVAAFAAAGDGLCPHHTAHTAQCGYVAAVAGVDCTHVHDTAVCGYVEAVQGKDCACEANDENGTLVHTEGCGYVAAVTGADCTHVHDAAVCQYVAAVEAKPCAFAVNGCPDCKAAAPKCTCETKCAEDAVNADCAVCAAENADLTACTGKAPHTHAYTGEKRYETKDASFHTVTVPCPDCPEAKTEVTEENHSPDEKGQCTLCGFDSAAVCNCAVKCGSENINESCALCAQQGENACTGGTVTAVTDSVAKTVARYSLNCIVSYGTVELRDAAGERIPMEYDIANLAAGTQVTVIGTPELGYQQGELILIYQDENKKDILVQVEDGTFSMPACNTILNLVFETCSHTTTDGVCTICGAKVYPLTLDDKPFVGEADGNTGKRSRDDGCQYNADTNTLTLESGDYISLQYPGSETLTVEINGDVTMRGKIPMKIIGTSRSSLRIIGVSTDGVTIDSSAHVKIEDGLNVTLGAGIYRTSTDGQFTATSGKTLSGFTGYVEFIGKGHYTTALTDDNTQHTVTCNCIWNPDVSGQHSFVDDKCIVCDFQKYPLFIAGQQVMGKPDADGKIKVTAGVTSGTVTYHPATNTLTLPEAKIAGNAERGIEYTGTGALNLKLGSINFVSGSKYGIWAGLGSIRIEGSEGSLDISGENGIYGYSVNISSGTVNVEASGGCGIYAPDIQISGGKVKVNSRDNGTCISGTTVTISGGSVTANSISAGKTAITAAEVTISGGTVEVSYANNGVGIRVSDKVTITGGTVTATSTGGNGYGIHADGDILIKDGTVTASGGNSGIAAENSIAIEGSTVVATSSGSQGTGIHATNNVTINDGTVKATGSEHGIFGNSVTISGGTVEAKSTASSSYGIYADGTIAISGGVTVDSRDTGIRTKGDLTISGGTVEVDSSINGIIGDTVSITGGTVEVGAVNVPGTGIGGRTVSLSGGTVTVSSSGDGIYASTASITDKAHVTVSATPLNQKITVDGLYRTQETGEFSAPAGTVDVGGYLEVMGVNHYSYQSVDAAKHKLTCNCEKIFGEEVHIDAYEAEDNVITETCVKCDWKGATFTLNVGDKAYDGEEVTATVDVSDSTMTDTPAVAYYQGETKLSGAPFYPGEYTARITLGSVTAQKAFKITIPEVVVLYNGSANSNGWYKSASLFAPDGYIISTIAANGYASFVDYEEVADSSMTYYLLPENNQQATPVKMEFTQEVKVDSTAPEVNHMRVTDIGTTSATIHVTATDTTSGISSYNVQSDLLNYTVEGNTLYLTGLTPGTDYTVQIKIEDNAGNSTVGDAYLTTQSVTAPTANSRPYDGTAQNLVNAGEAKFGTMFYCLEKDGVYSDQIPMATNAGTYTVWYYVSGNAGYADTTKESVTVTIDKVPLTISGVAIDTKVYDRHTNAIVDEVTFNGFANEETFGQGTDFTVSAAFADGNAGENKPVTVTVTLKNTTLANNYYLTSSTFSTVGTITPWIVSAPSIVMEQGPFTYNGKAHTPWLEVRDNGLLIHSSEFTVTYSDNVNAGTASVKIEDQGGNYLVDVREDVLFEILPAKLTIAAENQAIYAGKALPKLTYKVTGLVKGETLIREPKLTTTADPNKPGTYPITVTGTDAGSNYTVTYVAGELKVLERIAVEEQKPAEKPAMKPVTQTEKPKPITVPISGEEKTVRVEVEIKRTTASVDKVDNKMLHSVIGSHVKTGMVTIDFSVLDKNIDTVVLHTETIQQIAKAALDEGNDTEALEIKLTDGASIKFCANSLAEKVEQARGKDITISIRPSHKVKTLTTEQKQVIGLRPAYDVTVMSDGKYISDLGGEIIIRAPYILKQGEREEGLVVYYVDDEGNREACETSYDSENKRINWKTDHLSLYMIAYEEPAEEITKAEVPAAHTPAKGNPSSASAIPTATNVQQRGGNNWLLWISCSCFTMAAVLGVYLFLLMRKQGKYQR